MQHKDIWDAKAAARYDTPGTGMFDETLLRQTVDRLEALAEGVEVGAGPGPHSGHIAIPIVEKISCRYSVE